METDSVSWVESAFLQFGDGETEKLEDEGDGGWFEEFDFQDSSFEHLREEERRLESAKARGGTPEIKSKR